MSSHESVSFWIGQMQAGDRQAVQRLWEGYFRRLVGLVRGRLRGVRNAAVDEEDVALSAFDSFCRAAEAGRFPKLEDRDDLWQLLVLIASRKAADLCRRGQALRRGGGVRFEPLAGDDGDSDGPRLREVIGHEPDPALAAEVGEQCERLLALLPGEQLRQIALLKLQGSTNAEIAGAVGRSVVNVEMKVRRIRECWDGEWRKRQAGE